MLEALQDSTQKLEATVRQLRVYTGRSRDTYRTISLGSMLQEAIQSFETKYGSVRVTLTVPDTLEVDGYPDRLRHVVVNVMDNAGQAMPEGGTLRVTGGRGADEVYLRFEDDGVGMTEAQTTDAFRRFATTRRDEGGTGLGLPIAKRIVEHEHHGRLELRSQLGRGTEVTIRLPITRLGAP